MRFVRAGDAGEGAGRRRARCGPLVGPTLPLCARWSATAGAEDLVHQRGHLYVYRSAEGLAKDGFAWALRRENGVEIDEFDADELRQLEPALSRDYVRGLLVRENGHTSNPLGAGRASRRAFPCAQGGEIVRARALGFRLDGSRLDRDPHRRRRPAADAAIVCAGAYSKPLAAALGDRVPLETERGYHLMIRDPEIMPRIPTADADGKFVATPMDTGLRFAGTVELAGLAAPPDWRRAQILLDAGPPHAARPRRRRIPRSGSRCGWAIARRCPIRCRCSGRRARRPDVIYAFGHGHVGMTAAPMTGKIVADLVAGRPAVDRHRAVRREPVRLERY